MKFTQTWLVQLYKHSPCIFVFIEQYYYECVICELGGKLLCCDNCPRTYHLECLDPALKVCLLCQYYWMMRFPKFLFLYLLHLLLCHLKRIPTGKWECPTCSQQHACVESMNHLDPISKRARTKIIIRRSKTETESSATDKATQALEAPVLRKKRYSEKGKSPLSRRSRTVEKLDSSSNDLCGTDQSNPVQDGSANASSSYVGVNGKQEVSRLHIQAENTTTPVKGFLSLPKKKKSNMNHESAEINPEASPEKFSPGREPVLALEAATPAARKRKHKAHSHNNEKKCKTNNGKSGSEHSKKGLLRVSVGRSGASKSQGKYKIAGHDACSAKQDVGADMVDVLLKDEVCFFLLLCFLFVLIQSLDISSLLLDLILCLNL